MRFLIPLPQITCHAGIAVLLCESRGLCHGWVTRSARTSGLHGVRVAAALGGVRSNEISVFNINHVIDAFWRGSLVYGRVF